jgi:gliding motility-associated-like protein
VDNCDIPASQFPSGGSCTAGDQKWNLVPANGTTTPDAPVDLTSFAAGNYILEVYYEIKGSSISTTQCNETVVLNNAGNNYKASFSIQAPVLVSANPTTCNGSEGSITISGLTAGATYAISYTNDGYPVGPVSRVANGSGQMIISGLKAGLYSDFELAINGCTTDLNTGVILSNPVIIPKFNKIAPFCAGTSAPTLAATSLNGITGTWSPAVIDNQTSGSYTFTPNPGQCGVPITINVIVNPRVTPTFSFGTSLSVCSGGGVPSLPSTSNNGIMGSWNPSIVDNQNSATYTFTPTGGQCAANTTFTVNVHPNITPAFGLGTSLTICAGNNVPVLPTTSNNGITGTWSPATVDNQNSGTYTFTPDAGQCATSATFTVTVNPNLTPVFSFGTSLYICAGGSVPSLPSTSNNGITGTWNPATVDNQKSGVYTFTPSAGLCAPPVSFSVTITPNITPTFSFGTSLTICGGGSVPALPNTSTNGITGTWNPATVDNQNSATYTFTPGAGQCATTTSFSVTAHPNITPAFSFGNSLTICAGDAVPTLPTTSNNGITGTWNPANVDDQNSGTYTFTPSPNQCAVTSSFTVTVNPIVTPLFSFGSSLSICAGSSVPSLPTTSTNGLTGSWSPATVNNQSSAVYTFTPDPVPGKCLSSAKFKVTVIPNLTPTFDFGPTLNVCSGSTAPVLPSISSNGVTGVWSPFAISNQAPGTYTFTSSAGQCATPIFSLSVAIIPIPTMDPKSDTSVNDGSFIPTNTFSGTPANLSFSWTNSNTSIGLSASGTGSVPSFSAINKGSSPAIGTVTVTPILNGCAGTAKNYKITVIPLEKDVFVPNVFTPNADGKNDILYAYSNYIDKLEMRIFNQWGQQVELINDPHKGWDGKYKGTPQPVGVYIYTLKAVMTDGRTIQLKGSITLLR